MLGLRAVPNSNQGVARANSPIDLGNWGRWSWLWVLTFMIQWDLGGGGGEFTCLKSEGHVYLVTVFCCHTLYSALLDVCDYGHLWLQEASRLYGSPEWGCEGQTMTWRMASKASCCMRIYCRWCCSLPLCRGSKWHRGWVYAILRETHLSLNSLLLG